MSEAQRDSSDKVSENQQADQERQAKVAREQMMRVIFSSEARDRLNNLRMVKPDLANAVENQVFQLASSGRLRHQINDEELKQMLGQLQRPKKEFKINYK
ncbi:MAG TPA: DNA-binding protein [Nitrososphaerales archaeon]|nr:DNA-binding protein [Nitrososphaerales archaeon]